ncbi:TPA: hypothetical protein ACPJZ5_004648 [Vibrio diabolicus]|uniref:hypothetical protein n=1 Tax=Vibrio harveyi group TaxID=717610 RepID=UPI0005EE053F|nr:MULTISPECIES: hypothetical protein [Vibrio harveyi group]HAS6194794.1 hypothetical protein [Vibrio vulnificus]
MSEKTVLEKAYERKALLSYKSDSCKALSSSLAAASIAWFGLYLAHALNTGDVVYPIFAIIGCALLPLMSYGWYSKGKGHTAQVAKLEAEFSKY